jgi:hypothetical protein
MRKGTNEGLSRSLHEVEKIKELSGSSDEVEK